jgi:hypothetical protein
MSGIDEGLSGPRRVAPVRDPRTHIAMRTAAHLAEALGRLRLDGINARSGTRLITRAVIAWAEELGWMPVTIRRLTNRWVCCLRRCRGGIRTRVSSLTP